VIGTEFIAVRARGDRIAELNAHLPVIPFATESFFESKQQVGYESWVLGLADGAGRLERGCGAFLKRGKLDCILEIVSLPAVDAQSSFWEGLRTFCRQQRITQLQLGTYGSPPGVEIPAFGNHCTRRNRCEFVLSLTGDLAPRLGSNHKRNVKRGQQAGLVVRRTRSADAASAHEALMNQSMDRRRGRGENVTSVGPSPERMAYLRSGAGELFQALRDGAVLSSVLVLRAPKAGYYQSAGTSADGMALGASHFLIHSVAAQLKADGAELFNLGGADEESSLARFKGGFGAIRVFLPEMTCYVGPAWRRRVGSLLTLIRSDRKTLVRFLVGDLSRMVVYAARTEFIAPPKSRADLEFRALPPEDLQAISIGDPAFRARQLERLSRFGASYAYAVFVDGQISHISWLLPPAAMARDIPKVLKPQENEAEITCSETLPAFQGRGIYTFAIQKLFDEAHGQGVRRILMKTAPGNKVSQRGIRKAGLKRVGSAVLITLPITKRMIVLRWYR
jgi:ribosomal protein S18 acetylase RimI-like enzyme